MSYIISDIAEPSGELWTTCHVKLYTIKLMVEKMLAEIRSLIMLVSEQMC